MEIISRMVERHDDHYESSKQVDRVNSGQGWHALKLRKTWNGGVNLTRQTTNDRREKIQGYNLSFPRLRFAFSRLTSPVS